jgi:hypothetical protein
MKSVKNDAIATRDANTQVAVYDPGLAADDIAGVDNITASDTKLPFLAIAQKTSKAIDRSEGKYIEGLEFGEMYNSETREVYGIGPITIIPVRMSKRAHLKKENGTNGERVAWDDARVTWEGARAANLKKPEGVRIYDWAAILTPSMERVMISFSSTSFGAGQSLNSIIDKHVQLAKMAKKGFRPYQLRLELSVFIDKNDAGSFGKFLVTLSGTPVTAEEFAFANAWYEAIKDKELTGVGDEEGGDAIEGEVVHQTPARDNVPF